MLATSFQILLTIACFFFLFSSFRNPIKASAFLAANSSHGEKSKIRRCWPDERSFARKKKNPNKKSDWYRTGSVRFLFDASSKCAACKNTVDVCFCPGDLPSAVSSSMNNKSTLPHYARASLHFLATTRSDRISMISYHHSHPAKVNFFFSPRNRDGRRGNTRR